MVKHNKKINNDNKKMQSVFSMIFAEISFKLK
jgi:hypothetical protein